MNIEYLHYFLDVAQTKSITRAAKLNFISPQGMSRAMNELEKELGCELLIRYSNKLDLSPVGKDLVPQVADIVERYSQMINYAAMKAQAEHVDTSIVQLVCQNVAMLAFLTQAAKDYVFESSHISFREAPNSQIRQALLARQTSSLDNTCPTIGLVCAFNQEKGLGPDGITELEKNGLVYHPYLKSYDCVMVSASSDLAKKAVLSDEDITSRPLVTTNSHLYDTLSRRFGADAITLASSEFTTRKRLVERDAAVSFLPAFAALTMSDEEGYVLRDMEKPYEVEISFVGTQEDLDSESFAKLVSILDDFYHANLECGLYALFD